MVDRETRRQRIAQAQKFIQDDPYVSKRQLQRSLKGIFGVGLSDTIRRQLLQEGNSVGSLRVRLRAPGVFSPRERRILGKVIRRTGNPPYIVAAINQRTALATDARAKGLTRREYLKAVRQFYRGNGWVADKSGPRRKKDGTIDRDRRVKGRPDIWKMLRDLRRRDIETGEYVPPVIKKPRIDKGDIKAQRVRHRERQQRRTEVRQDEVRRRRQELEDRRAALVEKRRRRS